MSTSAPYIIWERSLWFYWEDTQADLNLRCYNDYLHIVSIALFWRVSWYNRVLQTFAASHPLSTEPLKQSRSTIVVDTTLFSDLQVHQHWHDVFQQWVLLLNASMVMSGRSVKVTTLIPGRRLRPPKQFTSTKVHILPPETLLEAAEELTKVRSRTG